MIEANPRPWVRFIFSFFLGFFAQTYFSKIEWPSQKPDDSSPVLLICNHQSWWDAILIFLLHQKIWKQPLLGMMRYQELKKRKFLTHIGAFSIRKNTTSLHKTWAYTLHQWKQPHHVLIFPQGRLESPYVKKLNLARGVRHLLEEMPMEVEVWALSIHYSMTASVRAQCAIFLQEIPTHQPEEVEFLWNRFHQECLEKQREKWS